MTERHLQSATAADVAAWGEQWLCEYIEDATSPTDREEREWFANGWRQWSLETWLHCSVEDRNNSHARDQARNHLSLYRREPHGLLIWRAYAAYRSEGLEVPENVLEKLDQWAARLERTSGPKEIAQALELTSEGGGAQGASRLAKIERQRVIVSAVAAYRARGIRTNEAIRRTAVDYRLTFQAVKSACDRWHSSTAGRTRLSGQSDTFELLRMFGG